MHCDVFEPLPGLQLDDGPFQAVLDVDEGPAVDLALGGGIMRAHRPDLFSDPFRRLGNLTAHANGVIDQGWKRRTSSVG